MKRNLAIFSCSFFELILIIAAANTFKDWFHCDRLTVFAITSFMALSNRIYRLQDEVKNGN